MASISLLTNSAWASVVAASVARGDAPFLTPSGAYLSTSGSTLVARTFGDALSTGAGHTA